jgi:hypothetical protein
MIRAERSEGMFVARTQTKRSPSSPDIASLGLQLSAKESYE